MRGARVRRCCLVFGRIRNECSVCASTCDSISPHAENKTWHNQRQAWQPSSIHVKHGTRLTWSLLVCSCARSPPLELYTQMYNCLPFVFDDCYHVFTMCAMCFNDVYHLFATLFDDVYHLFTTGLTIVYMCFYDCLPRVLMMFTIVVDDVYYCV
jgi:hypothetical protein